MSLELTSDAFRQGETIPRKYTADGQNTSPPLRWQDPPDGTRSFALVCEDPDAPRGTFTHWALFNLPAEARQLNEGVPPKAELPDGSRQGKNDFGRVGYGGPAPPPGKPHRYSFKLYALDRPLDLSAGASKDEILTGLKGHTLAEGQLKGTYGR
jgi:Raf kinase inhibitor-like YbhB/YbcL family protein